MKLYTAGEMEEKEPSPRASLDIVCWRWMPRYSDLQGDGSTFARVTSRAMCENGSSSRSKSRQCAKYAYFMANITSTVRKTPVSVVEETLPFAPTCKNTVR